MPIKLHSMTSFNKFLIVKLFYIKATSMSVPGTSGGDPSPISSKLLLVFIFPTLFADFKDPIKIRTGLPPRGQSYIELMHGPLFIYLWYISFAKNFSLFLRYLYKDIKVKH